MKRHSINIAVLVLCQENAKCERKLHFNGNHAIGTTQAARLTCRRRLAVFSPYTGQQSSPLCEKTAAADESASVTSQLLSDTATADIL